MSHINFAPNARLADHSARVRATLNLPVAAPTAKPLLSIPACIALGVFAAILIAIVVM